MAGRFNHRIAFVLAVSAWAFWWLLISNPEASPPEPGQPQPGQPLPHLAIAQLRALAASQPGPLPTALEVETVATMGLPGDLLAAGIGMKRRRVSAVAFHLPVPGHGGVVIDSGLTPALAAHYRFANYDPPAQARIEAALDHAGLILATQEAADHIAALATLAARPGQGAALPANLLGKARLNPAQQAAVSQRLSDATAPASRFPAFPPPLGEHQPQAVAPGIVVIPTGAHSPGSQLIYARLADGREYLIAGPIVPLEANLIHLRARSRLVGSLYQGGDRAAVMGWLLALRDLQRQAPALVIVPGHDWAWLRAASTAHLITPRFSAD